VCDSPILADFHSRVLSEILLLTSWIRHENFLWNYLARQLCLLICRSFCKRRRCFSRRWSCFRLCRDLKLDEVTKKSIVAPQEKILSNAGKQNADIHFGAYDLKEKESQNHIGYDVKSFKVCNMIEAGIVDSTKAIKNALINAVSASNTLLLTNYVVTNKRGTYGTEE